MVRKQRGISLSGALAGMIVVAVVGLFAAKLMPSYLDYFAVKKMVKAMVTEGELKGNVAEIRRAFDRRNAVDDIRSIKGDDLEITKEGGQAVVRAEWSVKMPVAGNLSVVADFVVTSQD